MKTPKKSHAKLRSAEEPEFPEFELSKKENARDTALVVRISSGDETAFTELVNHHWKRHVAFNLRRLHCLPEAEDAALEQFQEIYRAIKNGNYMEEGKFGGWALRLAFYNVTHLIAKKKRTEYLEEMPDTNPEPDKSPEIPLEFFEIIEEIRKELPEEAKKIIELNFYENIPVATIETSLGKRKDSISGYKSQILKKLNKAFFKKIIKKNTTGFCDFLYIDSKGALRLKSNI